MLRPLIVPRASAKDAANRSSASRALSEISVWLGHATIDTTAIYAEIDIETNARAVVTFDAHESVPAKRNSDKRLMAFLHSRWVPTLCAVGLFHGSDSARACGPYRPLQYITGHSTCAETR